MTAAEKEKKYELMNQAMDALMADDWDRMLELNRQIVMNPDAAMISFRVMGKEHLIETGFDLSAANEKFGEGWMDEPTTRRRLR